MSRPLLITDCDEVLLHMVRHFRHWLDQEHGVDCPLEGEAFFSAMRRRGSDQLLTEEESWRLLGAFFDTRMDTQTAIEGAVEAIAELQKEADVAVLTNLGDSYNEARVRQLRALGVDVPVYTNQGLKGAALKRIVDHYQAERVAFVDDIAQHHKSVAELAPQVRRLHFCGEPAIAPFVPCALAAGHAHARLDDWGQALPWLLETLHGDDDEP